jgi:uncharacterized YigZ family protein
MRGGASAAGDAYRVVSAPGRFDLRVKGSRFIGFARAADSAAEAEAWVAELGRRFHDATHVAFAYRLRAADGRSAFRSSDAGEPAGTAGRPILDALERRGLSNTVCAVVRYFGGVKLGTGGLARAYGECASAALDAAGSVERVQSDPVRIAFAPADTGKVMALARKFGARVEDLTVEDPASQDPAGAGRPARSGGSEVETALVAWVRRSRAEAFKSALRDATAGRARFSA